ncbi:hypothetical protein G6038_18855 [Rhodococcus sp. 14C212]|nr:hypothetical protein [Rhodococcus sp. 14C212]NGP07498.1 hypothetical protein [Rhodococcus sp. 14C212]
MHARQVTHVGPVESSFGDHLPGDLDDLATTGDVIDDFGTAQSPGGDL